VDPPLKDWIFEQPDVVAIEYHTSFPYPGDPFFFDTIPLVTARLSRYGLGSVPNVRFDGPHQASPRTPSRYAELRAERIAVPSHTTLELTGSYAGADGMLEVAIDVETVPDGAWRLFVVTTESDIFYEAPNGIDVHHHVMQDMPSGADGIPVDLSGAGAGPLMIEVPFTLDAAWATENVYLVAFLQQDGTNEVDQAVEVRVVDLPPTPIETGSWGALKGGFRR